MKIRLYRGPFDGRVIKEGFHGNTTLITGMKKLSREKQFEFRQQKMDSQNYYMTGNLQPAPMVQAEYIKTQFIHPDGSVFYEWTGRSRDYGPQLKL